MGGAIYGPNWKWRLSGEERALGLAFASALRNGWDVDDAAVRIAAIAGPRAIRAAIEDARSAGRRGPRAMSARAEASLRRALVLQEHASGPEAS